MKIMDFLNDRAVTANLVATDKKGVLSNSNMSIWTHSRSKPQKFRIVSLKSEETI